MAIKRVQAGALNSTYYVVEDGSEASQSKKYLENRSLPSTQSMVEGESHFRQNTYTRL